MKPTYSTKLVVPFGDIDMMGHVNNARYFAYFENARAEHLYSIFGKTKFGDLGLILAHAEIDYKSPARLQDQLTIDLRTASVGNSSWVYEYEIVNEKDNRLVATGRTVQVAYDYKSKKAVQIPPEFKKRLLEEIAAAKE